MDFIGKTNEDIIKELLELINRGEKITVQDIVDAVSTRSVVDTFASSNAVTIFYSGETEELINELVKQASDDVRIIRRTEAYDFLARREFGSILRYAVQQDNPDMLDMDVKKEVNRLLYEASSYESGIRKEGQGFWTVISRRFAAETTGDAYSLCGNAKPDRIFAMDELHTWLENASDDVKMCGYTKAEILELPENERFELIKEYVVKDFDTTEVFFNENGEITGRTFKNSDLEGYFMDQIPEKYGFKTNYSDYMNYALDTDMAVKYVDYDNYTSIEKLQIKQYDYEKRIISDMIDRDVTIENSIELISKEDLQNKYDFIKDVTNDDIMKELQLSEYRKTKYGMEVTDNIKLYFDDAGNIIAVQNQKFKLINIQDIEGLSTFSTTIDEYLHYSSDADMILNYNDYKDLSNIEKIQAKQADLEVRKIAAELGDINVSGASVQKYISAAGKTIDELNLVDRILIKLGDNVTGGSDDIAQKLKKLADKCSGLSNVAKKALPVVDTILTIKDIYDTTQVAEKYYDAGEYGLAAKTVSDFIIKDAGGWAASTVIAQYTMGFGAVVGGTFGVVTGALVAGVAGFAVSELVVDTASDIGYSFGSWLYDLFHDAENAENRVVMMIDPLIADIGGDGFNITSRKNGVNFDLNCDGFAEKINWTTADGLLSYDINGNGQIDNGREVFGDYHLLADGTRAKNGFEALKQYDVNEDGIIDKNDEIFGKLRLWIDSSADGLSDEGELKTLEELNIIGIKLNYAEVNRTTDTEALIGNVATFVYADNSESEIGEMWVSSDLYDTVETFATNISEAVAGLPNVRSYGTVNSLHNAMELDETGKLQSLVEQFVNETDMEVRKTIVEDILWFLCDAENIASGSRGGNIDARKLKVIERFLGEGFMGVNGSNPNSKAADILENAYNEIIEMYCFSMLGSKVAKAVNSISVTYDENGKAVFDTTLFNFTLHIGLQTGTVEEKDVADIMSYIGYLGEIVGNSQQIMYDTFNYFRKHAPYYYDKVKSSVYGVLYGDEGDNSILGSASADIIISKGGNDTINCGSESDLVYGEDGKDKIFGEAGNDIIEGGKGNDILEGGYGVDTYIFNLGDGIDTINNRDSGNWSKDRIVFGEGINPEDLELRRDGLNLRIKNIVSGDRIIVTDAFKDSDGWYYIGGIKFADGTEWGLAEMRARTQNRYGSEGNDVLTGYDDGYNNNTNEIFYTGPGDDIINAGYGNDEIYAGSGNNVINAGYGNDTIYCKSGNDKIVAGSDNDYIYAGAGNDTIEGGYGVDTYVFNLGDGIDTINNYDSGNWSKDRIVFGEGINPEDLELRRDGLNLRIKNIVSGDRIIVTDAFKDSDGWYYIGGIKFADGTEWGLAEMRARTQKIYGSEGNDTLTGYDDGYNNNTNEIFYTGPGDDTINAGYGNDEIYAGSGNNVINAGYGNDTIYCKSGNDKIVAGSDNDYIYAGAGNDTIEGGYGVDTYVFNLGDGIDTINNYDSGNWSKDRIVFGEGINPEDLELRRDGLNLRIKNIVSGDRIIVTDAFKDSDGWYYIGGIKFADGTEWGLAEMRARTQKIYGSEGNDTLTGYDDGYNNNTNEIFYTGPGDDTINAGYGNDEIYAGSGNNVINAGYGNDTIYCKAGDDKIVAGSDSDYIYAGAGNDTIEGGYGVDTYVFNLGDGVDTINNYDSGNWSRDRIVFGEGVNPEDLELRREGLSLIIENILSKDKITVSNAFKDGDGWYYIGGIKFADGTEWGLAEMRARTQKIYGSEGNDTLTGYDDGYNNNTSEIFYAGAGDDTVNAGYGNDEIYAGSGNNVINAGYGNDTIYSESGNDKIVAGADNDYIYAGAGNDTIEGGYGVDTYVFNLGDGVDTINNYDSGNWSRDRIVFGEGVNPEDLELRREGLSLIIENMVSKDKITVSNAFKDGDGWYYIGGIKFADGTEWGLTEMRERTQNRYGSEGNDTLTGYDDGYNNNTSEIFYAGAGDDTVNAGYGNDEIYAGSGNNVINAGSGNDTIYCENGNDKIMTGSDNDYIYAGAGNDTIEGGYGVDTYVFNLGDGVDTINNYDSGNWSRDRIVFGEGVNPEDLELRREGLSLIIENMVSKDKITVSNAFKDGDGWYYIGGIKFADGTEWGLTEMRERTQNRYGSEGKDTLTGYDDGYNNNTSEIFYAGAGDDTVNAGSGNDEIYAGSGNNVINAGSGNDTIYCENGNDKIMAGSDSDYIYAGAGNDTIEGGYGVDTYVFNLGDGVDTINNYDSGNWSRDRIVFGEGVNPEDLELRREGLSLIIENMVSKDKITVSNAFKDGDGWYYIGGIKFADGTEWGLTEMRERTQNRYGGEGNDTLTGYDSGYNNNTSEIFYAGAGDDTVNASSGNDVIDGGIGTDSLYGNTGNDTYIFYKGSGNDTISDGYGTNTISFTDDIRPEDIIVSREGTYNIILNIEGTDDSILIKDFMYSASYRNFTFQFADGRTATFDTSKVCLIYEALPEEVVSNIDILAQENAQSLEGIMAVGDTSNEANNVMDIDLASIMLEENNIDVYTDNQASLLAQELSVSSVDNNVFASSDATIIEESQLFTEQYVAE